MHYGRFALNFCPVLSHFGLLNLCVSIIGEYIVLSKIFLKKFPRGRCKSKMKLNPLCHRESLKMYIILKIFRREFQTNDFGGIFQPII